jgi:preprotein translocase subunit SecB
MPENEGRPVEISPAPYRLISVLLDDLHVNTEAFTFPHPKRINIGFTVTEVDEIEFLRLTQVKVEFLDKDDDKVASVESSFKVQFAPTREGSIDEDLERELNIIATRISYPYHRQLVSDVVTRMGLRPTFLPAVPDDLWQANQEAAEEVHF